MPRRSAVATWFCRMLACSWIVSVGPIEDSERVPSGVPSDQDLACRPKQIERTIRSMVRSSVAVPGTAHATAVASISISRSGSASRVTPR